MGQRAEREPAIPPHPQPPPRETIPVRAEEAGRSPCRERRGQGHTGEHNHGSPFQRHAHTPERRGTIAPPRQGRLGGGRCGGRQPGAPPPPDPSGPCGSPMGRDPTAPPRAVGRAATVTATASCGRRPRVCRWPHHAVRRVSLSHSTPPPSATTLPHSRTPHPTGSPQQAAGCRHPRRASRTAAQRSPPASAWRTCQPILQPPAAASGSWQHPQRRAKRGPAAPSSDGSSWWWSS